MDKDKIRIEAELMAIKLLVARAHVMIYRYFNVPAEAVFATNDELTKTLGQQVFENVDPVASDMMADEIRAAVQSLISSIEEMAGMIRRS